MSQKVITREEMQIILTQMCEKAVVASRALAAMSASDKKRCLNVMADELINNIPALLDANGKDMDKAVANNLSSAMLDRLRLDEKRIRGMAEGLRQVAAQEDPVGKVLSSVVRPNGLRIDKVCVPLGVIAIIFESRPNVTADAAGICIKAGNAVILRGGSEALHSNIAIAGIMNRAGIMAGLPDGAVQLIDWTDHAAVNLLLKMNQYIDLVIPRGGERLIRTVVEQSTIPVIKHYKGVCHLYVDSPCNVEQAVKIITNAKVQRPSACNAVETVLINRDILDEFLPPFLTAMKTNGVRLKGGPEFQKLFPDAEPATEEDFYNEYLDLILSVRIVDDVIAAVEHINKYGSRHSDGILSTRQENINYFLSQVDSSTVYANASTRFTDGGEFGMGAEIGISTDKLHARGPMGVNELTSYKYIVLGDGQIRE